jgi:transcriptional regulator with PAS, ATPase and Fis domain
VRIVAAHNADLREGDFRADLFFRLDVLRVQLPPLRERPEDLDLLVPHLLRNAARATTGDPKEISDDALALLRSFDWPGNVRELEHTLLRAHLISTDNCIDVDALLASAPALANSSVQAHPARDLASLREAKRSAVDDGGRRFVEEVWP